MGDQFESMRAHFTYLRQTFSSKLFSMKRRVLQLDNTWTTISDKLGDMDRRAAEVARVVRESSLAIGFIEALMRKNVYYALFVMRAAENFLAEQTGCCSWSDEEEEKKRDPTVEKVDKSKEVLRKETLQMRKEERLGGYRGVAEDDIYGMGSDVQSKLRTGEGRQDPCQKYLSLLWSLTGQKFRRTLRDEDEKLDAPKISDDDDGAHGLTTGRCCSSSTDSLNWIPSGFDFLDILAIVYSSMPREEELRRLFNRIIDAEMLRRKAQHDAKQHAHAKVAMTTQQEQQQQQQKKALSLNGGFTIAGRFYPLRKQGAAFGSGEVGGVGGVSLGVGGVSGGVGGVSGVVGGVSFGVGGVSGGVGGVSGVVGGVSGGVGGVSGGVGGVSGGVGGVRGGVRGVSGKVGGVSGGVGGVSGGVSGGVGGVRGGVSGGVGGVSEGLKGHEGDNIGLQGDRHVAVSCLSKDDMEGEAAPETSQAKRRPPAVWSCIREEAEEGVGTVPVATAGRTYGRLNSRKSPGGGIIGMGKDRLRRTKREAQLKRLQKKKSDQALLFRNAEAVRKTMVQQCLEGQRQKASDHCSAVAKGDGAASAAAASAAAAAGVFPSPTRDHRTNRAEPAAGSRSSVSYTICSPSRADAATRKARDAQRFAEDGAADGRRTKK